MKFIRLPKAGKIYHGFEDYISVMRSAWDGTLKIFPDNFVSSLRYLIPPNGELFLCDYAAGFCEHNLFC
jgi:hypothetical protein